MLERKTDVCNRDVQKTLKVNFLYHFTVLHSLKLNTSWSDRCCVPSERKAEQNQLCDQRIVRQEMQSKGQ